MKASFRTLETLGRPVASLLAGSALGGGWEVALIGHARFALDDASIKFGTPEVALGLIPGATGITKTVRKLGLMAAQPYLLEGKLFGSREAQGARLDRRPRELARRASFEGARLDRRQPRRDAAVGPARLQFPRWHANEPEDRRRDRRRAGRPRAEDARPHPATQAILETMVEGALVDYDTATRIESRKLAKVMVGQTAKNMIQAFFFDLNAIRSGGRGRRASRSGGRRRSASWAPG